MSVCDNRGWIFGIRQTVHAYTLDHRCFCNSPLKANEADEPKCPQQFLIHAEKMADDR